MSSTLNKKQMLALGYYVGFRGKRLIQAVATSGAESAWDYLAVYTNENGSTDRGLWQSNSTAHPEFHDHAAFLPVPNARFAYDLSNEGRNWTPWYAFGGARYLLYYALAATSLAAAKLHLWKKPLAERVAEIAEDGHLWVPKEKQP